MGLVALIFSIFLIGLVATCGSSVVRQSDSLLTDEGRHHPSSLLPHGIIPGTFHQLDILPADTIDELDAESMRRSNNPTRTTRTTTYWYPYHHYSFDTDSPDGHSLNFMLRHPNKRDSNGILLDVGDLVVNGAQSGGGGGGGGGGSGVGGDAQVKSYVLNKNPSSILNRGLVNRLGVMRNSG